MLRGCDIVRYRQGFTLVELLVTILLIAIVLPTAMRGISLSTRMADYSRRQIEATALAKNRLSELIASREWEKGTLSRGYFGDDFPDYEWSLETTHWEVSPMTQLSVTVYWNLEQPVKDHFVTLSTLVFSQE
jgi:prepilin-type N-terminal cleavage/methylation domain-containing protein